MWAPIFSIFYGCSHESHWHGLSIIKSSFEKKKIYFWELIQCNTWQNTVSLNHYDGIAVSSLQLNFNYSLAKTLLLTNFRTNYKIIKHFP